MIPHSSRQQKTLLQRLKLRAAILSGYFFPVFLSIATAFLVYFQGVRQVEQKSQAVDRLHTHIDEVKDLAFSITAMEKAARGYLVGQDPTELDIYEQWDSEFYERSETIRYLINHPEQREILKQIIDVGDRMNELYRRLISYLELKRPAKAQQVWQQGDVQAITQDLTELVARFEAYEQSRLDEEEQAQQAALQTLSLLVFGIATISGAIALLLGIGISGAISQHMNQEAGAIAASSSAIATTLEQQEQNSTQQASAVSQTTTTLDELNASFRKAEAQAKQSAVQANQALELSQAGQVAVTRTLEGLKNLQAKVNEIRQHSDKLSDKSTQIASISRLVGEIAAQTNMLALNAAIEAVRAGEQGVGFGVVAGEIRRLADQSQESAVRINQLITEIRQEIETSAQATETGTQTVTEGVAIGQEMAAAFLGVTEAVQNVVTNNQQLALNAKQQATAMQQILIAMNDINQAAQNNASGVSFVRTGMEQLNLALKNLKALV